MSLESEKLPEAQPSLVDVQEHVTFTDFSHPEDSTHSSLVTLANALSAVKEISSGILLGTLVTSGGTAIGATLVDSVLGTLRIIVAPEYPWLYLTEVDIVIKMAVIGAFLGLKTSADNLFNPTTHHRL